MEDVILHRLYEFTFKNGIVEILVGDSEKDAFEQTQYGMIPDPICGTKNDLSLKEIREQLVSCRQICPPLKQGIQDIGETVVRRWAVFNTADAEDEYGEFADMTLDEKRRVCELITGWSASYSGAGQSFSDSPYMKQYGKKFIVKQRCGLDI